MATPEMPKNTGGEFQRTMRWIGSFLPPRGHNCQGEGEHQDPALRRRVGSLDASKRGEPSEPCLFERRVWVGNGSLNLCRLKCRGGGRGLGPNTLIKGEVGIFFNFSSFLS